MLSGLHPQSADPATRSQPTTSFSDLADLLGEEFGRPDLSRDQLYGIARNARLLAVPDPPFTGHTLADKDLSNLFVIDRTSDAAEGWLGARHCRPLALPQGVTIMRRLVAQDIERGTL